MEELNRVRVRITSAIDALTGKNAGATDTQSAALAASHLVWALQNLTEIEVSRQREMERLAAGETDGTQST